MFLSVTQDPTSAGDIRADCTYSRRQETQESRRPITHDAGSAPAMRCMVTTGHPASGPQTSTPRDQRAPRPLQAAVWPLAEGGGKVAACGESPRTEDCPRPVQHRAGAGSGTWPPAAPGGLGRHPQPRAPLFCGPLPPYLQDVLQHVGLHRGGRHRCPASVPGHAPLPAACRPRDGRTDGLPAARHQHARFPPPPPPAVSTGRGNGRFHPARGGRLPPERRGGGRCQGCGPSGVPGR